MRKDAAAGNVVIASRDEVTEDLKPYFDLICDAADIARGAFFTDRSTLSDFKPEGVWGNEERSVVWFAEMSEKLGVTVDAMNNACVDVARRMREKDPEVQ